VTSGAAAPPHQALVRAKARLDRLALYPRPVRIDGIRIFVTPWFFRLPWFRRFDGYALHTAILVRSARASDDLVTHELCHVWQMQHKPFATPTPSSGRPAPPWSRRRIHDFAVLD
jgi:hypothetical protein